MFSLARKTFGPQVSPLDVIDADAAGPTTIGIPAWATTVLMTRSAALEEVIPKSMSTPSFWTRLVAAVWAVSSLSSVSRITSS